MFIRAYLRASTDDQDASRAREALDTFASENGQTIAAYYTENASGAKANRAELRRLMDDARPGDVVLVESVDRLTRLPYAEWEALRRDIEAKGLRIVAQDLPTSHAALYAGQGGHTDEFTGRMLDAVNSMMVDMLAALARKDYEQRRQRQAQGIKNAKAQGKYQGRPRDQTKHERIRAMLDRGDSWTDIQRVIGVSRSTVARVNRERANEAV